jgi:hypothetical protein
MFETDRSLSYYVLTRTACSQLRTIALRQWDVMDHFSNGQMKLRLPVVLKLHEVIYATVLWDVYGVLAVKPTHFGN